MLGVLLSGGAEPPAIVRISTEESEDYVPRPVTTIILDRELEDEETIFIASFPSFPNVIEGSGTDYTVEPTQDLDDGVPFEIKVFFRPDPESESTELTFPEEFRAQRAENEDANVYSFRTQEFAVRRDFLNSLPQTINGNYTVAQISERSIQVRVIRGTEESRRSEIEGFLASKGITEPRYTLSITDQADTFQFPQAPEGFEQSDAR